MMSEPDDDDGEVTNNIPEAVSDNCGEKEVVDESDDDVVPSPPEKSEASVPAPAPAPAAQQEQQPSSRLSGRTTTTKIAEPPRWRFVNSAKKSLGYSSTAAGTVVQGLSAQELAERYVAPTDTEQPRSHHEEEAGIGIGIGIGRVSVPSFLENGSLSSSKSSWSSSAVVTHPKTRVDVVSTKPTISAHHERQQNSQEQQLARLQELKDETQKMQDEHTLLRVGILEAERRKETLEKETREVREDKERLMREKAEVEEAAVVVPAQAAPAEITLVSTVVGGDNGDAANDDDVATSDNKQGKCKSWGMYALIAILLCAVAALLGVMLMGNSGDSNNDGGEGDPSNLRGPSGGVGEPAIESTPLPPVPQPPIVATLDPTVASTEVSIADPADANKPGEQILDCPSDSKQFDITVQVGQTPSAITWVLLDRCTFQTFFKCTGCYQTSPPNYPVSFAGCLPSYNNATGEAHEYVLRTIGSFEYVFRVEDEIKFSSVEGEEWVAGGQSNYFGEGGCSEAPSETLEPTQSPTDHPSEQITLVIPYPTYSPSALGSRGEPGCTPFVDDGAISCANEAEIEFKLSMPREDFGDTNNKMFGSSVTFVGEGGRTIAVGSGVPDSAIHIYHKPENPYLDDYFLWEYLTSIEMTNVETSTVLFGASLDSNDEGYIVVGAPSLSGNVASGMAFVYRPNSDRTNWDLVTTLTSSGDDEGGIPATSASFGSNVAFEGALIAVGSSGERNGKGSVYIFEKTGNVWTEEVKLSPRDVADGARFGTSVSLHGETPPTLAVGAPGDDGGGSAFVYTRSDFNWLPRRLTSDEEEGDDFGSHVVVSGCTVAVSSPKDNTASMNGKGTIRIFNWDVGSDDWVQSQIIGPGDELFGNIFGECIAMEGNTLLAGSPGGGEGGDQSGVIYHFERLGDQWVKLSVIPNSVYAPGDEDSFGCPLSLSGDTAVVGSRGDSANGPLSGSILMYDLCPVIG